MPRRGPRFRRDSLMDDIRRQDLRLFLREVRSPGRLLLYVGGLILLALYAGASGQFPTGFVIAYVILAISITGAAYSASVRRRFYNKRMESLWNGSQDRLTRFEEVLRRMRRDQQ